MKKSIKIVSFLVSLAIYIVACADGGERDNPYDPYGVAYERHLSYDSLSYDNWIGDLVDSRDGQKYRIVKIGDTWWMAENLNYKADNSYCYNDNPENCEKFGRLYQWAAANDLNESYNSKEVDASPYIEIQGICPQEWSLPKKGDFESLYTYTDKNSDQIKSDNGWSRDYNGMDNYGMTILPSGYRDRDGTYKDSSTKAIFWTTSEEGGGYAYSFSITYYVRTPSVDYDLKERAFAVRCIRNPKD